MVDIKMKWIHLGQEFYTCVDDEDYHRCSKYLWRHNNGYAQKSTGTISGSVSA
jgi:hypothetical protein